MLVMALLSVSLATFINTAVGSTVVWYTIDIFYVLIPLVFLFTCMKSSRHATFVAALLWLPALMVLSMVLLGLFFVSTPIWNLINMSQVFIYVYLAGTRLTLDT